MAGDGIAARFDNLAYDASKERILDTVLMMRGATTGGYGRAGVRPGAQPVTVGTGPDSAIVAPMQGIVDDATRGTYRVASTSTKTIALAARPSSGQSRIDVVAAKILNGDVVVGDGVGVREIDIYVTTGTATAGTPTSPGITAGHLRLAELVVPASGTISVQNVAQRTVASGGILPVANQAERDAISVIYDGLTVYREDTDVCEQRQNGAWEKIAVAGRGGNPYAEAAGVALCSGSGVTPNSTATVNISFPASRFTQPPIVTFSRGGFVSGSGLILCRDADTVTTTGARLVMINAATTGSASFTNLPLNWRAVQMTAAAAAG